jgi:hypothetical protein
MIPTDVKEVASQRMISVREATSYPGPPSAFLLFIEAGMVAEMARTAHLEGRKFTEWPRFEVRDDRYAGLPEWGLFARATTVPTR